MKTWKITLLIVASLVACSDTSRVVGSSSSKRSVSLDSCVVFHNGFDIEKKCFHCVPNAVCYLSFRNDAPDDLENVEIVYKYKGIVDTFKVCALDTANGIYTLCGNPLVDEEICGYYEQVVDVYHKIKYGDFYIVGVADSTVNVKNSSFKIRTALYKKILVPE